MATSKASLSEDQLRTVFAIKCRNWLRRAEAQQAQATEMKERAREMRDRAEEMTKQLIYVVSVGGSGMRAA
jgi:hypothetical protein